MEEHREISRAGGETGEPAGRGLRARGRFRPSSSATRRPRSLTAARRARGARRRPFLAKLRESPFYPAGGGQVTDQGWIELDDGSGARAELVEAVPVRRRPGARSSAGEGFAAGDRVKRVVPWSVRFPTTANHTATHLLHQALREVLGDHVAGGLGGPAGQAPLRLHARAGALRRSERERGRARSSTSGSSRTIPVLTFETPIDEARKLGATMLFGEKYGDIVRVVEVQDVSRELCGGTHVRTTAEIGAFAILSEGSVGSGARRIEAVTSGEAYALPARARRRARRGCAPRSSELARS